MSDPTFEFHPEALMEAPDPDDPTDSATHKFEAYAAFQTHALELLLIDLSVRLEMPAERIESRGPILPGENGVRSQVALRTGGA
jgi:hypothetical protein